MSIQVVTPQQGYAIARRFPRYKVDVPVRVITQGLTRVTIVQGRGSELNIGGMAVFAGTELSIGAQVVVEFTPPYSGQPIRVRCFVRSRAGEIYGRELQQRDALAGREATLRDQWQSELHCGSGAGRYQ